MNATRHQAYKRVLCTLQESGLRPREQRILENSAEGLLLDDPDSRELLQEATAELSRLVVSDRWLPDQAEELLAAIESCGVIENDDVPF